jgi:uncharacterized protein YeaO (DUF488 family)
MAKKHVAIKRIYQAAGDEDGARVLVDRVWPRGVRKDAAMLDEWAKQLAPSTQLRQWYGRRSERFDEFAARYRAELDTDAARAILSRLRGAAEDAGVTLLTATKDVEHSQAAVLADLLRADSGTSRSG